MTVVNLRLAEPSPLGPPVDITIEVFWTPLDRGVDSDLTVIADPFSVVSGPGVTIDVEPGYWHVREHTQYGRTAWLQVPESATPVDYGDLVTVDPDSLLPLVPFTPMAAVISALGARVSDLEGAEPGGHSGGDDDWPDLILYLENGMA